MKIHNILAEDGSPVVIPDQYCNVLTDIKYVLKDIRSKCFCGSNFIIREHFAINKRFGVYSIGYTACCENIICGNSRIISDAQYNNDLESLIRSVEDYTERQIQNHKTAQGRTTNAIKGLVENLIFYDRMEDENLSTSDIIEVLTTDLDTDKAAEIFKQALDEAIKKYKEYDY